jgi:hypothetical protein
VNLPEEWFVSLKRVPVVIVNKVTETGAVNDRKAETNAVFLNI